MTATDQVHEHQARNLLQCALSAERLAQKARLPEDRAHYNQLARTYREAHNQYMGDYSDVR